MLDIYLLAFTNGNIKLYGKNIPLKNGHLQETMITRSDLEVKSHEIYLNSS